MKVKIKDLTNEQLDLVVAKIEYPLMPSTYPRYHADMKATGVIMEAFKIELGYCSEPMLLGDDEWEAPGWYATMYDKKLDATPGYNGDTELGYGTGPTWTIAVLRAYASSVHGKEVEL